MELFKRNSIGNPLNAIKTSLAELAPGGVLNLENLASELAHKPALKFENKTISYEEYINKIKIKSEQLHSIGIYPGQRVAVNFNDPIEGIIMIFSLMIVKAIAVLLPTKAPKKEIERILNISKAATIKQSSASGMKKRKLQFLEINIYRPATIIFTSGSNGNPKAVVHTAANHIFNALGSAHNIPLGTNDTWMIALPLYHVSGLSIIFRTMCYGACSLITSKVSFRTKTSPEVRLLDQTTHLSLVETQFQRLFQMSDVDLSYPSKKAILVGGSSLSSNLFQHALKAGIPVCGTYGCTEMGSQISTTSLRNPKEIFRTSGKILPFRRVKIDTSGEILLGGATLCAGYIDGDNWTRITDNQGFFASGDVGKFCKAELMIIGRKDALFISGGENIQPEEIELTLKGHPDILEAICVPVPDTEYGKKPVAFISVKNNLMIPDDLNNYLQFHLAKYKLPKKVFNLKIYDEVTSTTSIKYSRTDLTTFATKLMNTHR